MVDAPRESSDVLLVNQPFPAMQEDPDAMVARAREQYPIVARLCMFSGGNDSLVLAHRMREHYDFLFHMDTGTGVDEGPEFSVRAFVQQFAQQIDKPLLVYSPAPGDSYESVVLNLGGFPGPAGHGRVYTRLKERQEEDALRQAKRIFGSSRFDAVMFLSGKRREESKRRGKTTVGIEKKKGSSRIYVNPLIDWTRHDMRDYRREHSLEPSPVAALLHRSGECNCGAFSKTDEERLMLENYCPRTWARIAALEQRSEAQGERWCRWGGYDLNGIQATREDEPEPDAEAGVACSSCEFRLFEEQAA